MTGPPADDAAVNYLVGLAWELHRAAVRAWWAVAFGLVLAGIGLGTFLHAVDNGRGGLIWSGGVLVGFIFAGRGVRRLWLVHKARRELRGTAR